MSIYLQAADLKAMSEFPAVQAKNPAVLESVYITRAEIMAGQYGPFAYAPSDEAEFRTQMRLAVFLVAERLVLAQPSAAAAAAGLTSETIGKYSYSRASGGGNVGNKEAAELIPAEAISIFQFWSTQTAGDYTATREVVFDRSYYTDDTDTGLSIFAEEVGPAREWATSYGQSQ